MARLARVVVPGIPHHITQRGNRRQPVFFRDDDYMVYLELLKQWSSAAQLDVKAYCLMPNHIHVVCIPSTETSLHKAFRETHRRYSCMINLREGWRGYLWQGRFSSFPMDEEHTSAAIEYVENNPVRAQLVATPEEWQWSSYRSRVLEHCVHTSKAPDKAMLDTELIELFRRHERTGRPLGTNGFIHKLEMITKRTLFPKKRGPKPSI